MSPSLPSAPTQHPKFSRHQGQAFPIVCVWFRLVFVKMLLWKRYFSSLLEQLKMNQKTVSLHFFGTLPIRKRSFPQTDDEAMHVF